MEYQTDRLIMRPSSLDDVDFFIELLNTPKWLENIGDRHVKTQAQATEYLEVKVMPQFERLGYGNFTLIRKSDLAKVGCCGLYDRPGLDGVDIGFSMLPAYERQGYGFESASFLLRKAKEEFDLNKVNAITIESNIASQKLLEKLGLSFVKIIKLAHDPVPLMLYSIDLK